MIPAAALPPVVSAAPVTAQQVSAPTARHSYVARIVAATRARTEPRADAPMAGRVRATAPWNDGPMQLLIVGVARPEGGAPWYRVLLAKKPNESYGWIPADYAKTYLNRWRIEVDVSSRRLTIFRSGRAVRSTRTVVGARSTPTPRGRFAIRELVRQPDPGGFSGPWIFHLNANSPSLKSFDGGDGTIGIHGRGDGALSDPLGSARSHGCIRVPNSVVSYMASRIVAGTPVRIKR